MSQSSLASAPATAGVAFRPGASSTGQSEHSRWFSEEIHPHEPALRAYLRARFPTLQDVDDQIQETYARLFQAKEAGRRGLNRAYLFVVARNATLDIFRRRKAVPFIGLAEIDSLAVAEERPSTADRLDHERELALLAEAVNALPDRCREIFTLRRFLNWSHQDIAATLGISENTVNAQLVIGMTRCRQFLRSRHVRKTVSAHDSAR
jgi:RNA polymerase sigma factor (sigma-70 family)